MAKKKKDIDHWPLAKLHGPIDAALLGWMVDLGTADPRAKRSQSSSGPDDGATVSYADAP